MMNRKFIVALATFATCFSGNLAPAQEAATAELTGKAILAKHVEAVGGAEKMKATKTTVMKGKYQMPEAGLDAPMTITFALPDKAFFEIEIPGMGKILKGSDGNVAWENSAMSGPRILEGAEKEQFLREADSLSDLTPDKYFKSIENLGKKDVNGRDCYEVKFTTKSDKIETRYFDAETFLVTKSEQTQETPMGEINIVSTPSDYKDVDGMKVAHNVEISMLGQKQRMKIESVKFNGDVADSTFELPAEIKELQEAAEEAS